MKKIAFSMVEIMVVLITMGVIAGAITPVLTKRITSHSVTVNKQELKLNCSAWPNCKVCTKDKCTVCPTVCGSKQVLNIDNCTCEDCSTKFTACRTCTRNACTACNGGYGLNDGRCSACGDGYYSDGTTKCQKAPVGHYASGSTQTSYTACSKGYFQNTAGQSSCKQCSVEHPGTYQDQTGQAGCKVCPEDYKCGNSGTEQCTGATGSKEGSLTCSACSDSNCIDCSDPSVCLKCKSGYYLEGKSCSQCPAGYSCNGSAAIIQCKAGTYSKLGDATCTNCPAGKYSSIGGVSDCNTCPSNQYQPYEGQTSCYSCGGYISSSTTCNNCSAGQKLNASKTGCDTCPKGTYSTTTNATSCTDCPANTYSDTAGASSSSYCKACTSGYSSAGAQSCSTCPPGKKVNSSKNGCTTCELGTYQDVNNGSQSCKSCGNGYSNADRTSCTPCKDKEEIVNATKDGCVRCIIPWCAECDTTGCTRCNCDWKLSADKKTCLETCDAKFENCTKYGCNCQHCETCKDGYKLDSNNKCVPEFSCDGDNYYKIGNRCFTKRNMGDSTELAIKASGITWLYPGNSSSVCPSYETPCCWHGGLYNGTVYKTSISCDDSPSSGYSGCQRVVCNYRAAEIICGAHTAGGPNRTWELVTKNDFSKTNLTSTNIDNLLLCGDGVNSSILCNYAENRCYSPNGSTALNQCYPGFYWMQDDGSSGKSTGFCRGYISNQALKGPTCTYGTVSIAHGYSVRCVSTEPSQ